MSPGRPSFRPDHGPYDLDAFRRALTDMLEWLAVTEDLEDLLDQAQTLRDGGTVSGILAVDAYHGLCDDWGYEDPAPMADRNFRVQVQDLFLTR